MLGAFFYWLDLELSSILVQSCALLLPGYAGNLVRDDAVAFIANATRDDVPFFLYLPFQECHSPFQVTQKTPRSPQQAAASNSRRCHAAARIELEPGAIAPEPTAQPWLPRRLVIPVCATQAVVDGC